MNRFIMIPLLAMLLAGCAQQTKFSYELCGDGNGQTVCKMSFDDGKGRKYVHVTVTKGDTTLIYTASDVDASARAAIVSETVKNMAAAVIKAAKEVTP